MSFDGIEWIVFREWENKILEKINRTADMKQCLIDAAKEWRLKTHPVELIQSLVLVQKSLKTVTTYERKIDRCDKKLTGQNNLARQIELQTELERCLGKILEARALHKQYLLEYQQEQGRLGSDHLPPNSQRSLHYTAELVDDNNVKTPKEGARLSECREWLRKAGLNRSASAPVPALVPATANGDGQAALQATHAQSGDHRSAKRPHNRAQSSNGQQQGPASNGRAADQASEGYRGRAQGGGAGGNGGGCSGGGGGGGRRPPASRASAIAAAEDDEDDVEEGQDVDGQGTGTGRVMTARSGVTQRLGVDPSANEPAQERSASGTAHDLRPTLGRLAGLLNAPPHVAGALGGAGDNAQQGVRDIRPRGAIATGAPDSDTSGSSGSKGSKSGKRGRSVDGSGNGIPPQRPTKRRSIRSGSIGQPHGNGSQAPPPGKNVARDEATATGGAGADDGSSLVDYSISNRQPDETAHQEEASQQAAMQPAAHEPQHHESDHGLSEFIEDLPPFARGYALTALAPSNGLPGVEHNKIQHMVGRLVAAYAEHADWSTLPPITDYLTTSGAPKQGNALNALLKRRWRQEWDSFIQALLHADEQYMAVAGEFQKLRARLERIEYRLIPPSWPAKESAELYVERFRKKIVEHEYPKVDQAWKEHISMLERSDDETAVQRARDHFADCQSGYKEKADPTWPPQPRQDRDQGPEDTSHQQSVDSQQPLIQEIFLERWESFSDALLREGEHRIAMKFSVLRKRLERIKTYWDPPALPSSRDAETFGVMYQQYRDKVAVVETPFVAKAWQDRMAEVRAREGEARLGAWLEYYEEVQVGQEAHTPEWPPANLPSSQDHEELDSNMQPIDNLDRFRQTAIQLGFDNATISGYWTFAGTIGCGGYGHVALWVQYNTDGKIVDRKAVKESYLAPPLWILPRYWSDPDTKRLPREVGIHRMLSSLSDAYHIAEFVGWGMYARRYMFRLYLEYCPGGDLQTLINNHEQWYNERTLDQQGNLINHMIPETALWCVFEALASAACILRDRRLPGSQPLDPEPPTIFHRDLKPLNIFLADPDETVWKGIPVPKMGDFGLSIEEDATGVLDPMWHSREYGTPPYQAPEIAEPPGRLTFPYSSASDIFVIGCIMVRLINLNERVPRSRYDKQGTDFKDDYPKPKAQFFNGQRVHSDALLDLIKLCLRPIPGDRIQADALYDAITKAVQAWPATGKDVPMKVKGLDNRGVLRFKDNKYVLWAK